MHGFGNNLTPVAKSGGSYTRRRRTDTRTLIAWNCRGSFRQHVTTIIARASGGVPYTYKIERHLRLPLQSGLALVSPAKHAASVSQAMHYKGAPLKNRWGFIEDARRQICRPSKLQQEHYSGHKRFHCQKIRLLCILKDTRFYENIVKVARGNKYVIHGDPVYPLKPLLLKPYGGARLQLHQTHFNKCMSTVRQAVELGIGKVAADFAL
ncbi:hypothetical protein MRX96_003128 [Rhipicephalus microplus]